MAQGNPEALIVADEETIIEDGGRTLIWTAVIPRRPVGEMDYVMIRQSVNCRAGTMRPVSYSAFNVAGTVFESDQSVGEERAAIPGSLDAGVIKAACQREFLTDFRFGTIEEARRFFEPFIDSIWAQQ
jgi:hypothetical protein